MKTILRRFLSLLLCVSLLVPFMATGWTAFAEGETGTKYIFYPDFNSTAYAAAPEIFESGATPTTAGTDGWVYNPTGGTTNFKNGDVFHVVDNTAQQNDKMLEVGLSGSNRVVYHAFSEPISSGVYTMSFDFKADITTAGTGYYNICFMNSANVKGTTTQVLVTGGGSVQFSQGKADVLTSLEKDHWYRVTAVYDFTNKTSVCYVYDKMSDYETAVANGTGVAGTINLAAGATFTGVTLSGMGSSTAGVLSVDNWRMFEGTTEENAPALIPNAGDETEDPKEPEDPEDPEDPVTGTKYIFYPDFNSAVYTGAPEIFEVGATPTTVGTDGWVYNPTGGTSNFKSGDVFHVVDNTAQQNDKMLEVGLSGSNRVVYYAFSEPISSGVYTMSFDFKADITTAGTGYYNICFMNSANVKGTTTQILIAGDGSVQFGQNKVGVLNPLEQDHWYRVTAVYDFTNKTSVCYVYDKMSDYETAVANGTGVAGTINLAAGATFTGVTLSGMGSSTAGVLSVDNWRMFEGTTEENVPALIPNAGDETEEPEDPDEPDEPEDPEDPEDPVTGTKYIFYPDFNSAVYTGAPEIFEAGDTPTTVGTDGWVYNPTGGTSNFKDIEYFHVVTNPDQENDKMLEANLNGSNHVVYYPFSEPISSGVYTMSFDFKADITTAGTGYYNICFMNSANVKGTTTQVLVTGGGSVQFSQGKADVLTSLVEDHWYRVTAVYDFTNKTSVCYVYDNMTDFETAVANGTGVAGTINLAAGATFTGVTLSGMGSSTAGELSVDNWRMFEGTVEENVPALIPNTEKDPDEPEEPEKPEEPGEYLFYPNFNDEPYTSDPTIVDNGAAPGMAGIDGWMYDSVSTSNFPSSNMFHVVDHSTMTGRKMLEYYNSTSNRVVSYPFAETLYSGTYTMSFDFEVDIEAAGSGYYNFRLVNTNNGTIDTAAIRFYGDGSIRIGGSTINLTTEMYEGHWYRLTVVYNLDLKTATYLLQQTESDVGVSVVKTFNLPSGVGIKGFRIAGAGSDTTMTMHFDNWRIFTGTVEKSEPDFVTDPRPLPTKYLFNEKFLPSTYKFGDYIFGVGAENGTAQNWIKGGTAPHDSEYFRVVEHTKVENDLVGALYLTSGSNQVDRLFPEAVMPGAGVKLTFSVDFMLTPDANADETAFYRMALLNGTTRRDTTDLRVYANGNITFNNNKTSIAAPLDDQTDWHRLTVVYNLETMKADYYVDNVFVVTGGKFTIDANGVAGIRISGPAGAMGELKMDNFRAYVGDITDESNPPAMVDNSVTVHQPNSDNKPYADTTLAADTDYTFDYTFAWTTDPQNLVKLRPDLHIRNIQWLVANKDALNLKYVMNTGDLVNDSSSVQQWEDSHISQALLDNAGIPNGVLAGNHDTNSGTYSRYKEYYGENRYNMNDWYGGSYDNNFGHYDLITVGETDFIMVYMSYQYEYESNPKAIAAQIDWMNEVLAQYPNHRAILLFHDYLESKESKGRSPIGQQLFEEVVYPNENVFMVVCGHVLGTWRQETVINGRTVHEIVFNYQGMETPDGNGDSSRYNRKMWGMIRLLQMDVANNKIYFRTFSPLNDSITMYDELGGEAVAYERDHFAIDFQFGRPSDEVTVSGNTKADDIVYGQPLGTSKITKVQMVNSLGEVVFGTFAWQNGDVCFEAGTHQATAVFTPDDAYYKSTTVELTVTVLPLEVYVTPLSTTKVLGSEDPVIAFECEGLSPDAFSGALSRQPGELVGSYEITLGTLSAGNNYTVVLLGDATFDIRDERVFATVSGVVTEGESPLAGVTVTLKAEGAESGVTAVTDGNGAYSFKNVLAGIYTATVELEGYETAIAPVVIVDGDVQVNIMLTPITPPVDKSELGEAVEGALSEEQLWGYTAESMTAYQQALAAAKTLLADEEATQDAVDAALASLQAAAESLTRIVWGNVDGDGEITTTDARMILQYAVQKIDAADLDLEGADVDGDGEITTTDARLILQLAVGKISQFPVEQ